jgi:hypothetical protein
MGLFDSEGIAPETGMPDFHIDADPTEITDDDWDEEPIEHVDIRSTPVSLPDQKAKRAGKLEKDLMSFYTMIGMGVYTFDNQVGVTILDSAPNCAESLASLANTNPRLKKTLESLLNAGTYGAVISAHLPIAVIIATKYIPPVRDNYGTLLDSMLNNRQRAA